MLHPFFHIFFLRVGELWLLLGSMLGYRDFFGCDLNDWIGFIEPLFEALYNRLYSFNHEMWSEQTLFFLRSMVKCFGFFEVTHKTNWISQFHNFCEIEFEIYTFILKVVFQVTF